MRFSDALLVVLASTAVAAAAPVYRWVNPQGEVVYQDTPPPASARDVRTQDLQAGPSQSNAPVRAAVRLYLVPHCAPCTTARNYLTRHQIPFKSVDVTQKAAQTLMKQRTGYTTVPTISVGSHSINGFNQPWLASELQRAGYPQSPTSTPAAASAP